MLHRPDLLLSRVHAALDLAEHGRRGDRAQHALLESAHAPAERLDVGGSGHVEHVAVENAGPRVDLDDDAAGHQRPRLGGDAEHEVRAAAQPHADHRVRGQRRRAHGEPGDLEAGDDEIADEPGDEADDPARVQPQVTHGERKRQQHAHEHRDEDTCDDVRDRPRPPQQHPDEHEPDDQRHLPPELAPRPAGPRGHGVAPGNTARWYVVRSSRSPAARSLRAYSGPAHTVRARPTAVIAAVAPTSTRGIAAPSPPPIGSLASASSPLAAAPTTAPARAGSSGRQNALPQILATAKRVSRLVTTLAATRTQASGEPSATPACSRPSFPTKPDSGGMPARFMAGTKKSTASSGEAAANPPSRSVAVLPPTRSMIPAVRNSVVWMRMWWAT